MSEPHVRKRLPDERPSITRQFSVGGQTCFVRIGLYDDGQPGEMFLNIDNEHGSMLGGLAEAVAIAVSIGLQYGAPIGAYADKFSLMTFEPADLQSRSIMDNLGRWLNQREHGAGWCTARSAGSSST